MLDQNYWNCEKKRRRKKMNEEYVMAKIEKDEKQRDNWSRCMFQNTIELMNEWMNKY